MALNMQWTKEDFDLLMYNLQKARDYEKYLVTQASNDVGCLHMACPNCKGTGVGLSGHSCVHGISCSCKNCRTYCSTSQY